MVVVLMLSTRRASTDTNSVLAPTDVEAKLQVVTGLDGTMIAFGRWVGWLAETVRLKPLISGSLGFLCL